MGVNLGFRKIIALFFIFLIVSLTPVLALNYNIYGQERVDGVVAAGEDFTAEIVNPGNQVYINISGDLSSCSCDDTFNDCTCYFAPVFNAGEKIIYAVVGDSAVGFETSEMTYSLDAEQPQVIANSSLDGNELTVDYLITDTSGSTMFTCSGIKDFVIFINQHLSYTETFNTENCSVRGQAKFDIEPSPILDISFRATDLSGLNNEIDLNQLSMDAFAPVVAGTFEIYQAGIPIDRIALNNPQIPIVDVVFFVTEEELAPNGVTGDLTDFNNLPTQNLGYQSMNALCVQQPGTDLYECKFKNIKFHPEDEIIDLPLSLTDAQNNQVTPTLQRQYVVVVAENEVIHIGPELSKNCDANLNCYVNKNPIIKVVITGAEDSSFNQLHVPLKTGQLSSTDYVNPFKCEEIIDSWVCSYAVSVNEDLDGQVKTIYIDNAASDDYGKSLNGLNKKQVYIDLTPPEIIGEPTMLVNNAEVQDYCLTGGDTLTVQIEADDARSPELFMFAVTQATTDINHFNRCVKDGSKFTCTLDMSNFIPAAEDNKKIDISVQDLAGNRETVTIDIDLCMNNIEEIPNLVSKVEILDYNSFVDRKVAEYRYWKHRVPIKFSTTSEATIIDYDVVSCEAYDSALGDDYVAYTESEHYYLLNKAPTSLELVTLIGGKKIWSEHVVLNCSIEVYGRIRNTFYSRPETLDISVDLDFSEGMDAETVISSEIKRLMKDIKSADKRIKKWKGIDSFMKGMCKSAELIATVNAVIQATSVTVAMILRIFGLEPAAQAVMKTAATTGEFVNTFIWPAGNGVSVLVLAFRGGIPSVGEFVKASCFIYNCKYYDAGEIVKFADNWLPVSGDDLLNLGADSIGWDYVADNVHTSSETNELINNFNEAVKTREVWQDENNNKFYAAYFYFFKLSTTADSVYGTENLFSSLSTGSDTWVVNPSAILYNTRKRKALDCYKVKCLENAQNAGFGKEVCDQSYEYLDCLYLESAMVHQRGNGFGMVLANFLTAASAYILQDAFSTLTQVPCLSYYAEHTPSALSTPEIQSFCGITLTAKSLLTIYNGYNSIFSENSFKSGDDILDEACKGVKID